MSLIIRNTLHPNQDTAMTATEIILQITFLCAGNNFAQTRRRKIYYRVYYIKIHPLLPHPWSSCGRSVPASRRCFLLQCPAWLHQGSKALNPASNGCRSRRINAYITLLGKLLGASKNLRFRGPSTDVDSFVRKVAAARAESRGEHFVWSPPHSRGKLGNTVWLLGLGSGCRLGGWYNDLQPQIA